jgi:hypothetical protein
MAIDPADLIRRFEPVLFFHKDERFFPSDAKRYLEHCALWDVRNPIRDDKAFWGGTSSRTFPHFPLIARNQIAATADEAGPGRTFLGSVDLDETADLEHFLDPAGWKDADRVDADTDNSYANFDAISDLYQFNSGMRDSQFWYHAELFTAEKLAAIVAGKPPLVADFFNKLRDPLLLCYYLFFPAHEEPLEGCGDNDPQMLFGSYAGDWACVAVLLQGDGNHDNFLPSHIGLTSRNAGVIKFLGKPQRIGMRISDASLFGTLTRPRAPDPQGQPRDDGHHALIFVAKGTHGLYSSGAVQPVPSFSPDDLAGQSCGVFETLTAQNDALAQGAADADDRLTIIAYKGVAGAIGCLATSIGSHTFNPLAAVWGGVLGLYYGVMEGMVAYGGMAGIAGEKPIENIAPPQIDELPGPGQIGLIAGPPDVVIPDVTSENLQVWPRFGDDEDVLTTTIAGRNYSLFVGTVADPSSRPMWLPSGPSSYQGRWGDRVQHDPFSRRGGMTFPDFAGMFFDGLGV